MRFAYVVCCAALVIPAAASANELLKVYDLALQNDATLQASEHFRDASIEARPQARALLLPNISGSYGYSKAHEVGTQTTSFPGSPSTGPQPIDRTTTNKALTLTLTQPIFNWEVFKRFSQSGDVVGLAEAQFRAARQNLVLRVAAAYFNVLAAADALRSSDAENTAVERQLEQGKKRFEVGLSAITDVQEAQARYDLTVAQQIASRQALESAKEALAVITGTPTVSYVPLQDDIPLPAPDPTSVEAWIAAAAEGNLDLLASRYVAEIARTEVEIAWARHLPTLGVQGQYQRLNQNGGTFSLDTTSKSYGLQLSVPIFAGLGTQSQVRQARATREQRLAEYELTRRNVERSTRDAYQGVVSGASLVKAYTQAVVSNTTALEASETGLQVGARTEVDVLTASQLLYAAQRVFLRSRYDYLLSVLTLKADAGRLGAQDLAEIDRLLVLTPVVPPPPMERREPSSSPAVTPAPG